jgi:putative membrane protein
VAGVLAILVASDWPVHELAEERLLSVHMVQHLLMSLVAPPLLLAGTPGWLLRSLLRPAWLRTVVRNLARALPALLLFNAFIAFSHWPVIVDAAVSSELAHFGLHAALMGTALLMWMPVLSPMFEIPRLRYPGQMLYLFAQSIVPTVPASFLTFADGPIYPFYGLASPLIGVDAVTDQRIAGLVMKIVGGFILWGFIAFLFFKWNKQDELTGSEEPAWQDVERQANRLEVR